MEPFGIHPGGCSCTGCVYRSRSKEPNIQQLLQEGSDIDKLYFGKFLPLRERKLLEKLIRTRDVYDGVRSQLISASDQTIPKHKKKRRDEDLSSEQSSAVLQMVDLVDRGQMRPANGSKAQLSSCCSSCSCKSLSKIRKRLSRHKKHHREHRHVVDLADRGKMGSANTSKAKLDSCCSCCSCETLMKIRKRMEKEDKKHPKVHRQIVTCEDIAKYCEEAAKKGRKRRRKLSTKMSKLSSKIGSARLKIKRNLSEPTVISKSRAFVKRIRSKRKATDSSTEIVTRDQKIKTAKGQRRKVKKIQSHSSEDSATEVGTIAAKIKKDSLILFREKLLKKRHYDKNKHVECKPGTCKVGSCSPEECLKKIKTKGVGDMRRTKHHDRHSETGKHKSYISMKIRPKKVKVRDSQVEIAKTISSASLTTIVKTKDMPSLSKTELKGKIPVSPKPVKGKHGKALAKSAASMTSLPKLKAKAQLATEEEKVAPKLKSKAKRRPVARDKDLEENVSVEVLPKSKAKPATKSTSSSTSVAKEKATKAKSIKTLERHEGEPASPPKRHKTGRQKLRREPVQDMEATDIQEPREHVKTKKEKRIKPTHGRKQRRKYKHSQTQLAGALDKASKHSHLRDSTSQTSKPHGRNVLSKSKSQGRSALASMERLKRKLVGSAAFSQKTSSRSRTKSKQQQSKSAENFTKKSSYVSKEPPPDIDKEMEKDDIEIEADDIEMEDDDIEMEDDDIEIEKDDIEIEKDDIEIEENVIECYPDRQAVKISSSFTFNIEFSKGTHPCVEVVEEPDLEDFRPQASRPQAMGSGMTQTPKRLITGSGVSQTPRPKMLGSEPQTPRRQTMGSRVTQTSRPQVSRSRPQTQRPRRRIKQTQHGKKSKDNISSQSGSALSFKSNQVAHKLKRCFCTQKLIQTKKLKLNYAESKPTMAKTQKLNYAESKPTMAKTQKLNYVESKPTMAKTQKLNYVESKPTMAKTQKLNYVESKPTMAKTQKLNFVESKPTMAKTQKLNYVESKPTMTKTQKLNYVESKPTMAKTQKLNYVESKQTAAKTQKLNYVESKQTAAKTQKLNYVESKKTMAKKQKLNYVESKKTMASLDTTDREVAARPIRTQTKHSGIAYVVPPSTSTQASLLPYECEPDFCTPGECDPYECDKRIKQRNRRAGKHVAKVASTSHSESKSISSKIRSSENRKAQRKRRHTQGDAHLPHTPTPTRHKVEPKVSSERYEGTGQTQAVQLGSKFDFSVVFSKTKINKDIIYDRPIQREKKQRRPKGIKVYKPSVRQESSETKQSVKTKQTRTEPFLQRCLCTLKLLKKNKKKVEKLSPWRSRDEYVMHMQNGAENRFNPERSKFLPYECEPGSCIPKEYHPYDCEKLIKLRQIKLKHKYKCDLGSRSTFSKTSGTTTSSESQNTHFFTRKSRQKVNKIHQHYNDMNITGDLFKQRVMRGESNLSAKIEFSKEKSAHYKRKHNLITTEDCINQHTQNKYKSNTKGLQQVEHPARHTSIDTKPKLIEKGSSVVSVIKKCFSILKFPRKTNKSELQNKNNVFNESARTSHTFPNSQFSEYKNTHARSMKLAYNSSSHERSPNFFVPGMCTPHGRHEENKRRDIIKLDKPYANMNRPKRKSVMNVTSDFSGSTKAKSTQSRLLKHRTKEDQERRLRNKQRGMKAARSFSPSRVADCEGSNLCFNKKKSTNRFIPSVRNTTIKNRVEKYNTVSDISTINRMKDQHCLSQENNLRQEHKASDVGLFLKKCFCRMGLQKKNIPERDFHWQKPITTQFVQVEHNNKKNIIHNVTKSGCNVANKILNTKEPLLPKLPEGRYVFKENLIESQNGMKTPRYNGSHHLPNGSFTRRGHIRSQIDVNFDKIKNLLSIQKMNPFYQSFYALNVKVSKSEVSKRGDCAPGQCDPEDCQMRARRLKGMGMKIKTKDRQKQKQQQPQQQQQTQKPKQSLQVPDQPAKRVTKLSTDRPCKDMPDGRNVECYERCKAEFEGKKFKPLPGPDKPLILGSDFKIRAGVYKDTNPYKDSRRQALRIGSDARVDFDFFREPTRRNIFYTGPIPAGPIPRNRMMMPGSRHSFGRQSRQVEITPPNDEQEHKPSGLKLMMKRLSRGSAKLRRSARSDINQRMDEMSTYSDPPPKHKSTPRISKRREFVKPRYVTCKECGTRHEKPARKSTDRTAEMISPARHNVTFCSDVSCLEYAKERARKKRASITSRLMGRGGDQVETMAKASLIQGQKNSRKGDEVRTVAKAKLIQEQGKGEGDVEKEYNYGSTEGKKTVMDCLCRLKKIKCKCEPTSPTKCKCGAKKPTKCKCGTKAKGTKCTCKSSKSKEEIKREAKICSQLDEAERQMETIMPYSKKKFKKLESQSKLAEQNVCAPTCRTVTKETNRVFKRKKGKDAKTPPKIPDYDVRVSPSFECLCNKEARLRRLCPVCRDKAKGKFKKGKNKKKCTCMDEEIVPEKPKDLSKCPMCKESLKKKSALKAAKCPCCHTPFSLKDGPAKALISARAVPVDNTPRFEMMLNTTNMKIVNKEEVLQKIGKSSRDAEEREEKALKRALGHGSKCRCCVCRGIRQGKGLAGAPIALKPEVVSKPCVCGSPVCKKDWDKIKQEQAALAAVARKLKKCICGSAICAEESSKRPAILLEEARQEEHVKDLKKRAKAKEKAYQKARLQRRSARQKERDAEDLLRKQYDEAEMQSILKDEAAGNLSLVAESLIDLGTFGSKAFCDVTKGIFRSALHPRDVITDIRDASSDPGAAAKGFRRKVEGTGLYGTIDRIKARFGKMPAAKRVVKELESYPSTNYLIHMADKDPQKRMKTFKASKRKREPVEFNCSPYMSSMRRRPCLRIYYMCPWFYPHCVSLLGLWKQFLDVLLFILAVAVWSPCIMCMELCRGFVCCVLCQG